MDTTGLLALEPPASQSSVLYSSVETRREGRLV